MLIYLLKSAACMALFFFFYKFLLEKERMHVFKRWYLLLGVVLALLIPSLVFTEYVIAEPTPMVETTPYHVPNQDYIGVPPALEKDVLDIAPILWSIYFLGLLFFGLKFLRNLSQIISRIRKNPKQKSASFIRVLLQEHFPPHTFFNYIFLNKKKLESNKIPKEVLLHEETHARQKHSYDVIFIELLQVIFWFNPLVYFFKKAIKLNHEFLADQAVLNKNIDQPTYQNTLLSYLSADSKSKYQSTMANAITYSSYSSIKKRFTVMKTRTSKKSILLRSLLLLPLLALMLYGFSETKIVEKIQSESLIEGIWLDEKTEDFGLSITKNNNQLYLYYNDISFPVKKLGNRYYALSAPYDIPILVDSESGVLNFWNKNYVREANTLRNKFEGQWTSSNEGIQILIENYSDAFIWQLTKNGSTNKFYPKKNKTGFEMSYGSDLIQFKIEKGLLIASDGNTYNRIIESSPEQKNYSKPNTNGLNPAELIEYNELAKKYKGNSFGATRILTKELNLIHNLQSRMSEEQKENSRDKYGFPKSQSIEKRQSVPETQIKIYNSLAKKYNKLPLEKRVIPLKEQRILEGIHSLMTIEQKENAQPFPKFTSKKTQDGASQRQLEEYNALAKKYNTMLSKGNSIQIKIKDVERLEYIYSVMSDKQKAATEPFPNFPEPPPVPEAPNPPNEREEAANKIEQIINEQDPYDVVGVNHRFNNTTTPSETPISRNTKNTVILVREVPSYHYRAIKNKILRIELPKQKKELKQVKMPTGLVQTPNPPNEREEATNKIEQIINEQQDKNPKTEFVEVNGQTLYYTSIKGTVTYYNRWGQKVNRKGEIIDPEQTHAEKVLKGQVISKIYKDDKVVAEFNTKNRAIPLPPTSTKPPKVLKGKVSHIPAPPEPVKPLDYVIEMAKKGADFYYEGKEISPDKAIELLKKNKNLNIQTTKTNSGTSQVKISKEPIKIGSVQKKDMYDPVLDVTISFKKRTSGLSSSNSFSHKKGDSEISSSFEQMIVNSQKNNITFYHKNKPISIAKARQLLTTHKESAAIVSHLKNPKLKRLDIITDMDKSSKELISEQYKAIAL